MMISSAPASSSSSSSGSAATATEPGDALSALMAHISRLTITELDSLLANRNQPESRTPSLSDEELSLLLFAEEAEGLLNIAKNHVTSETELEDALFNALLEVEETAEYDRAIAIALSQGRNPPPRPQPRVRRQVRGERRGLGSSKRKVFRSLSSSPVPSVMTSEPQETITEDSSSSPATMELSRSPSPIDLGFSAELWSSIASTRLTSPPPDAPLDGEESSTEYSQSVSPDSEFALDVPSFPSSRSVSPSPPLASQDIHPIPGCIVCLEPIDSGPVVSTGCGHHLDVTCLRIMFENALKDASLFPPRCCDDLDLEDVHEHLDAGLISRFERRALEFRTKDPVYCCNPHCSTFMRGATPTTPVPILCAECGTVTCGSCKREAHPGETCASRELDEAMLEFAKARGWSRCPSCLHVVERTEGCPHMICLCQAQFCYLCAAVWKTCSCT